ncbi:MAG TPA: hypothetical protein VFP34_16095 [Microlunatus sp.]|nr:hypothetical protein [Microlunatus sp.]
MSRPSSPAEAQSSGGPRPQRVRTYEIGLDGDVAGLVRSISPAAQVIGSPVCTVLWHRVDDADELYAVLDALYAMGISPREVHEAPAGARRHCEVRIDGRLGDAVLRQLHWSYRVLQTTIVRVRTSQDALRSMLSELTRTSRLDYVVSV